MRGGECCLVLKKVYRKKGRKSSMSEQKFQGYTESFKLHVVGEVESGRISQCQARRRYGILGHSKILKLCRKYGRKSHNSGEKEMPEKNFELLCQANEIKALKRELEEARFKNVNTQIQRAQRRMLSR